MDRRWAQRAGLADEFDTAQGEERAAKRAAKVIAESRLSNAAVKGRTRYLAKRSQDAQLARAAAAELSDCLLYTSPSPRDLSTSRMPSSA